MMDAEQREIAGEPRDHGNINEWILAPMVPMVPHAQNTINKNLISTFLQCQTESASHLCIYSPVCKLSSDMEFTIGGTYNKEEQEFWFFGSTSLCHGKNYLLKLFVVPRKDVRYSLFLPKIGHNLTEHIKVNEAESYSEITGSSTKEYIFTTSKKNEIAFINAYRFTKEHVQSLRNATLLLPCVIKIHTSYEVHPDIINKIKLQYTVQLNEALYEARSKGDFILESATLKKFPIHVFVAAAHSPVLREIIKSNQKTFFININDEDVEMLVRFLYNGSIENLSSENARKILKLANILSLPGMFKLGELALSADITEGNAVEVAVLAKKYNLPDLSRNVFKKYPKLLEDSDLMRTMPTIRRSPRKIGSPRRGEKRLRQYDTISRKQDRDFGASHSRNQHRDT